MQSLNKLRTGSRCRPVEENCTSDGCEHACSSGNGAGLDSVRLRLEMKKRARRARALARARAEAKAAITTAKQRKEAVKEWHREERRLARLRTKNTIDRAETRKADDVDGFKSGISSSSEKISNMGAADTGKAAKMCSNRPGANSSKRRRVSFSDVLFITNIPSDHEAELPQPVQSPVQSMSVQCFDDSDNDENDPDFMPDDSVERLVRFLQADERSVTEDDNSVGSDQDLEHKTATGKVAVNGKVTVATVEAEALCAGDSDSDSSNDSSDTGDSDSTSEDGCVANIHEGPRVANSATCTASRPKLLTKRPRSALAESTDASTEPKTGRACVAVVDSESQSVNALSSETQSKKRRHVIDPHGPVKRTKQSVDSGVNGLSRVVLDSSKQADTTASSPNGVEKAEEVDIDILFAGKRKKSSSQNKDSHGQTPQVTDDKLETGGHPGRNVHQRYTEDGLRILTEDDIKAENTLDLNGDCPFDCSCCF